MRTGFEIKKQEARIKNLEKEMVNPKFWQNKEKAEKTIHQLTQIKEKLKRWQEIKKGIEKLKIISELISEEPEEELEKEFKTKYKKVNKLLEALRLETFFSGKYDRGNALLSIYAGAGGVDAQDWAKMLLRMYLRFCERKGWRAKILDESRGGEAGIKSVTLGINGYHSYGYLKNEAGVHRLVRLSPFNADSARHTSFALVEVLPEIPPQDVVIREEDIKIETFRASSAGGQSVNKTSSAVRIKHFPSGLVVQCQNERSQTQNKETALKILRAKLEKLSAEEKGKEKLKARGKHITAEWGNQIRSYVLHPYKLVKDHRTGYEVKNTDKVLDGEIEDFIIKSLKMK